MAHSSGGGSSSSGCHSGGSSRSSGSRSHSGSSGPAYRTSREYFPGSHRYRYYDRIGRMHYMYANYDITERPSRARYLILLFYIPFFIFVFSMFKAAIFIPQKLENPNSEIIIMDTANAIKDEKGLKRDLQRFYEETGVTPAVQTIYHKDWEKKASLEEYALQQYYKAFEDESHWLIVYSDETGTQTDEWAFEGIIGDDTEKSIGVRLEDVFTESMQKNILRYNDAGEAVSHALEETLKERKPHYDTESLFMAVGICVFILIHAWFMVFAGNKEYKKNAELVDNFG